MNTLRQRGLTVVELMIAITLGLLVVLAATTLLVASNSAYVAQAEAANVDAAGRFALAVIERAARQGAFIDWEREDVAAGIDPAAPSAVRGLDAASLSSASAALADPRPPAVNGSDVLALRFSGSGSGEGDGSATTCAGFSVGADQDGWSIFYVGIGPAGDPELRCKYRGASSWSAEAVIGGIDTFQVLYGLDTDAAPDGMANTYLSANEINALEDTLAVDGASELERQRERQRKSWWKRVASIKVALVVHGARQSRQVGGPAQYWLFGAAYDNGADAGTRVKRDGMSRSLQQRERRMFSSTILLRNPVRSSP